MLEAEHSSLDCTAALGCCSQQVCLQLGENGACQKSSLGLGPAFPGMILCQAWEKGGQNLSLLTEGGWHAKGHRGLAGGMPRQDHVFKAVCVSIRVMGHSYNQDSGWLCQWVPLESFTLLQETKGPPERGQSHCSSISQSPGSIALLWGGQALQDMS